MFDGVLLIDKPEGMFSFDVIRKLRPFLRGTKVGYLGILDPMARGVLPLLLGKATRLAPFLEEGEKVYEGTIRLGVVTDTQDRDGKVLEVVEDLSQYDLSPERIEEVFKEFTGRIRQVPPMFSAKKHKGRPLYVYARKGKEVPRDPKEVEVYKLELKGMELPYVHFYLECSKGTYVRTLAHDIGKRLGPGGHLHALTRLRNGFFRLEDSISLEEALELGRAGKLSDKIWDLNKALAVVPAVELVGQDLYRISHGQAVFLRGGFKEGAIRILDGQGQLVGLGVVSKVGNECMVRPVRVLKG